MCVLAVAWRAHPRWRLVVAANRDECHDRPADPLARWAGGDLIAGRDAQAGGTWLAVTDGGRFAAVTNRRGDAPDPGRRSRGALVANLARGADDASLSDFDPSDYNPFNAVVVGPDGASLLSNRPGPTRRTLDPGTYALSNGPLDPPWPKARRLGEAVERSLGRPGSPVDALLAALRDPSTSGEVTDEPDAVFVEGALYGTRCGTVVTIDRDGVGLIVERRYAAAGTATGETSIRFTWP